MPYSRVNRIITTNIDTPFNYYSYMNYVNANKNVGDNQGDNQGNNQKITDENVQKNQWSNTEIFGPVVWKLLHNTAINYPLCPSDYVKNQMKNFILSLTVLIPCEKCRGHTAKYIEKHRDKLDEIVSSRDNLFAFFVDFHNQVNKRYNKPIISVNEAIKLYT